ncbi:tetratricopeptide repeat protein [Candidatus Cyanaurora vandensis]|uniref:O-linked N-acetylglucosamine transferase, SPINDLY family protein n=1 Tax=Candidatus Cyanaurora vandensis TaxID=2714958 RepID=UPI00257C246A|nr:tetratricopeptide repeat protein [Candidatus Cyanaurora vandensis]
MAKPRGFGPTNHPPSVVDLLAQARQQLKAGQLEQARVIYHQVYQQQPDQPEALNGLGSIALRRGDLVGASQWLEQALQALPRPETHQALGKALEALGQSDAAQYHYEQALTLAPHWDEPFYTLGVLLANSGQLTAASHRFEQAIALRPKLAQTQVCLANVLQAQGQGAAAIARYRQALALEPRLAVTHSNLLLALQYQADLTQTTWQSALTDFAQTCAPASPRPKPTRQSRLRVGYVSPDFRHHSCQWFIEPLLASHDREQFEVIGYSEVPQPDGVTARLRALMEGWHSTVGLSDLALVELIRAHQLDILVDLAGHTASNRLPVFAQRLAPVQVSWLGFPGSTGLQEMDYRLSDSWLTPPGTPEYFAETVWNLDRPAHCYQPPADLPTVNSLPAVTEGFITFGSFNNISKVTDQTLSLWGQLLHQVAGSRLVLKSRQTSDPGVQQRVWTQLAQWGIGPERVTFLANCATTVEHLSCYHQIDLALDTFPYQGATTTLEALVMGVPVLSLTGERTASRYGFSFLSAIGLAELAPTDAETWVRVGVDLAQDRTRLTQLRASLREWVLASSLGDGVGFARAVEDCYRQWAALST